MQRRTEHPSNIMKSDYKPWPLKHNANSESVMTSCCCYCRRLCLFTQRLSTVVFDKSLLSVEEETVGISFKKKLNSASPLSNRDAYSAERVWVTRVSDYVSLQPATWTANRFRSYQITKTRLIAGENKSLIGYFLGGPTTGHNMVRQIRCILQLQVRYCTAGFASFLCYCTVLI